MWIFTVFGRTYSSFPKGPTSDSDASAKINWNFSKVDLDHDHALTTVPQGKRVDFEYDLHVKVV